MKVASTGRALRLLLCTGLLLLASLAPAQKARAGVDATCLTTYCAVMLCCTNPQTVLNLAITTELQPWLINFYNSDMRTAFRSMTSQWVSAIMLQAQMIGGFFDAQSHSSAMLTLQRANAKSVHAYLPSEALCQFGSVTKSLAASEALGRRTKIGMMERSQNRQMLNVNMASAEGSKPGRIQGRGGDQEARLLQYQKTFCSSIDSYGALNEVCDSNPATTAKDAVDSRGLNRDIDYTRTFMAPTTFDISFAGGGTTATRDQASLFALGDNLYGHNIMLTRPDPEKLDPDSGALAATAYEDFKTAIAKRSIAANSYASIAAMKTPGTNASTAYLRTIMTNLGMSATDIDRYVGTSNPSYYTQMEVLSRKIYQDPAFFANLMEQPANVRRQQSAMKAVSLMQERDIYDSLQRSEMLLSTLLEIYAIRTQKDLFNTMTRAE